MEFKFGEAVSPVKPPQSSAEHAAGIEKRLTRNQSETLSNATSPEMMMQELQNLRKKYDGVVEYTVHITSERDNLLQQLEVAQKELTKEKAKRNNSSGQSTKVGEKVDKKQIEKVSFYYNYVFMMLFLLTSSNYIIFAGIFFICGFNHSTYLLFGGQVYWLTVKQSCCYDFPSNTSRVQLLDKCIYFVLWNRNGSLFR